MLLTKLKVKNYLSVNGECELPLDPRVTVLLGANDHGKSNLLRSLEHLNFDRPILVDDENWDNKGARIEFMFRLTKDEIKEIESLLASANEKLSEITARRAAEEEEAVSDEESDESENSPAATSAPAVAAPLPGTKVSNPVPNANVAAAPSSTRPPVTTTPAVEDEEDPELDEPTYDDLQADINYLKEVLSTAPDVVLYRDGVAAPLSLSGRPVDGLEGEIQMTLAPMIPRVELFKAFSGELQDSITADKIANDDSEFLQGIFFYAGLDPLRCSELFVHDDETDKRLEEASKELDNALRQRWAQGVDLDLHFQLKHRGGSSIELLIEDPAVRKRKARMSKRSAGVTQFFRLSMVLHARRRKNPANSYIYIFDEPGVFLHPQGQKDLLSVFEQLAQDTQIVYATHSLFMLNQNFPERHRLITKTKRSTVVDSKPYRANWKYAVDALGVRLTANILFSPNMLLVEGDSDPIYLYEMLRLLNHLSETDGDANLLGIMSYSDLPNLRFLMQTFRTESKERRLAILFDGDSQGRQYQKDVSALAQRLDVELINLEADSAIEDYCLHPGLFQMAVLQTLEGSFEATDEKIPENLEKTVNTSWEEFTRIRGESGQKKKSQRERKTGEPSDRDATDNTSEPSPEQASNAGAWFNALSKGILNSGSSKVALARNYAFLSREKAEELEPDPKRLRLAKSLVGQIVKALALPSQRAKEEIGSQNEVTE